MYRYMIVKTNCDWDIDKGWVKSQRKNSDVSKGLYKVYYDAEDNDEITIIGRRSTQMYIVGKENYKETPSFVPNINLMEMFAPSSTCENLMEILDLQIYQNLY